MDNKILTTYVKFPFGELILGSFRDELCICDWRYRKMRTAVDNRIKKGLDAEFEEGESKIINETKRQLAEYFEGIRTEFTIPLKLIGTKFQQQVWNELLQIPYGKTDSYLSLSKKLGNEKAIRAVATANGANSISILVPCHRIIGSDGSLTGYAGGLPAKKKLLELEGALDNGQLELF